MKQHCGSHHDSIRERLRCLQNDFEPFDADASPSIPLAFEKQVWRRPAKLAVKGAKCQYTYAELADLSTRVAAAVSSAREGRDGPVALLLSHDAPTVGAILGVLKAGAAYVPLDPSFPERRNSIILEESRVRMVLTDTANYENAARLADQGIHIVCMSDLGGSAAERTGGLSPDDPAYIIFTSGSTGRPKGVMQTHRNVLRVVRRYTNVLHIGADDRIVLLPSCSVTASVAPLLSALLSGATVLPFDLKERGFQALAKMLLADEVTVFHSTPSVFRHFLRDVGPDRQFPTVRLVRLGGDLVYRSDFELFKRHFRSDSILVNGYGCSEMSSIFAYFMDAGTVIDTRVVPVGYPISDIDAHLVDSDGLVLATPSRDNPGIPSPLGEIVLQSEYLSPGYWGRPDLTSQVFSEPLDGQRLRRYHTGDLGYLLSDGSLVHAGRKDSQVKIAGFRVEITEIEALLREHPHVSEAVVINDRVAAGEQRLLAFVVLDPNGKGNEPGLEEHVHAHLPVHMWPAAIVPVSQLPFLETGKLDRNALLSLKAEISSGLSEAGSIPATAEQRVVADVWRGVLQLESIGLDQNFFELGGSSLLAVRTMGDLERRTGVKLPLRAFFDHPTIRELAALLGESVHRTNSAHSAQFGRCEVCSGSAVPDSQFVPASAAQQGIWFVCHFDRGNIAYNMSRTIRLQGQLDPRAWSSAVSCVISRHEALRTTFALQSGSLMQVIRETPGEPTVLHDITDVPRSERDEQIRRLCYEHAMRPFDLVQGPLIRALLLSAADGQHVFSVTMHHAIADGWSMDIFLRDVCEYYRHVTSGQRLSLSSPQVQYREACVWRQLTEETRASQLAYWKEKLAFLPLQSPLAMDYARPLIASSDGASIHVALSEDVSLALRRVGRDAKTTVACVLLAALKVVMLQYGSQEDLVVGCAVAGRTDPRLTDVTGLFANVLPLRTRLNRSVTFAELLGDVRETLLEAMEHQDIPLDQLARELHLGNGREPVVRVTFAVQDSIIRMHPIPEVVISRIELDRCSAKYDLTVVASLTDSAIAIRFEYNASVFDRTTIRRLADSFQELLKAVVSVPSASLPTLSDSAGSKGRHHNALAGSLA